MNEPIPMGAVFGALREWGVDCCPLPSALNEHASMATIRLAESSARLMADAQRRRMMQ